MSSSIVKANMDLSDISLATLSLDPSTCSDIICGSNGLPITPNSIKIIGEFKARVERVRHPNLIRYVECFRNKNEKVTLVFEKSDHARPMGVDFVRLAKHLLDALYFLHRDLNSIHGLISPECLTWFPDGNMKLSHWPINLLTNGGAALGATTLLATNLSFIAPEQVKNPHNKSMQSCDIWSAGLTLLKVMKPECKLPDNPCRLALCDDSIDVIDAIEGKLGDNLKYPGQWNEFFLRCLHPDPNRRASLDELYALLDIEPPLLSIDPLHSSLKPKKPGKNSVNISTLDISEVYYLWRLSIGRNFESERKQDDCPPIFKVPYLLVGEKLSSDSMSMDPKLKNYVVIGTKSKVISLEVFKTDLERLDKRIFETLKSTDEEIINREYSYPSSNHLPCIGDLILCNTGFESDNKLEKQQKASFDSFTFADLENLSSESINSNIQTQLLQEDPKIQPIVIKEANFTYQCERIVLFKRLISGGSSLRDLLFREASIDIPPYYRAKTWAILLNVIPEKALILYNTIDKTTPIAADRQISVDIPRCHQYNELMASPQGHKKLARILKAWLNHNMNEYVYWQGLDSLAAPFLLLNFDDEAVAFACFNAFVDKYLKGFFKKDNQLVVQQYLSMFSELLTYHDSLLAEHLQNLGFLPNLYAIPWFLTMFTHVLPLHKIFHVWDCLLLGDEKYPLCIGLAILNQLRSDLMNYSFNDCIVAFSDLPEIDIERCIRDASHFYNSTPDKLINLKSSTTLVDI